MCTRYLRIKRNYLEDLLQLQYAVENACIARQCQEMKTSIPYLSCRYFTKQLGKVICEGQTVTSIEI